jgi:TRAP-type C4-dicarboxylate transport system substrate-binding protein
MVFFTHDPIRAQAQEKKMVAKLADILSPGSSPYKDVVVLRRKSEGKDQGRMEIQVYHSAQLSQTKDLYLGMQMGNVEMAKLPVCLYWRWIPEVYVSIFPIFCDQG